MGIGKRRDPSVGPKGRLEDAQHSLDVLSFGFALFGWYGLTLFVFGIGGLVISIGEIWSIELSGPDATAPDMEEYSRTEVS